MLILLHCRKFSIKPSQFDKIMMVGWCGILVRSHVCFNSYIKFHHNMIEIWTCGPFFFLSKVLLLEWKFTVSSAAGALICIVKGKLEIFTCICFLLEKWNPNEISIWKYLKGVFSIFLIYYTWLKLLYRFLSRAEFIKVIGLLRFHLYVCVCANSFDYSIELRSQYTYFWWKP